jgi:hypothetical protein
VAFDGRFSATFRGMKHALLVLPVAAVLVLGGCSSSDSTDASPAPESPAASSPSASMIGPIMVKPGQTDVEATVGRSIVFDVGDDPGRWNIGSSNEEIVAGPRVESATARSSTRAPRR